MTYNSEKGNIILIGMPGTGKTTVGKLLSEVLGYEFIDTDSLIAEKTGKTPKQLVEERGREYFIEIQDEVVLEINPKNSVISTGGGLIHSDIAMKHLTQIGSIVFLNTCFQIIQERMDPSRKLVRTGGSLKELYDQRTPLYNKYANIVIDCNNTEPQIICQNIIEILTTKYGQEFSSIKYEKG